MFRRSIPLYYKSTLHFPKTSFPQRPPAMHLPSAKKDTETKPFCEAKRPKLAKKFELAESFQPDRTFVMHDGPPYANGSLHMGHSLNKILKDVACRWEMMRNQKRALFRPGWDCHGLPIELKVEQLFGKGAPGGTPLTPMQIRTRAQQFAETTIETQCASFQDWGIMAQWNDKYLTMHHEFEANELEVFLAMWRNGYIFRGERPVYWSYSTKTALAEAELEYEEGHVSDAIYVAFGLVIPEGHASRDLLRGAEVLIWTTTPWSLIGNEAVAYHNDLEYCLLECQHETEGARRFLVAKNLVPTLRDTVFKGKPWLSVEEVPSSTVKGSQLESLSCTHPLQSLHQTQREDNNLRPLIHGAHVTSESGTGLVHTAPGHGQDDFLIGKEKQLRVTSPVDDNGCYLHDSSIVPPQYQGLFIFKEGTQEIIEELKSTPALIFHEKYTHKYPYDWRSKKPIFIRATKQWFANVENLKQRAIEELEQVRIIPDTGRTRLRATIESRSEWCISRQRVWGVPIPVFYYTDPSTGEEKTLITEESVQHVIERVREHGTDCWWTMEARDLLPPQYRDNGIEYRKGEDTLDVWFDSGTTWKTVIPRDPATGRQVADLYLEGSDQHRGWFQSSLLTSVAMGNGAPFKTLLTHGFVNDEKGRKMSKSLGNIIEPKDYTEKQKLNPDILRLWATNADFTRDVHIGQSIMDVQIRLYKKIRNTFKFMLGVTNDFNVKEYADAARDLAPHFTPYDRYMLHRLSQFQSNIEQRYQEYQYFRVTDSIHEFVYEVSALYLDIIKDRLYSSVQTDPHRRAAQYVVSQIVHVFLKSVAPIMPHLAEEVFDHFPGFVPSEEQGENSVFDTLWPDVAQLHSEWLLTPSEQQAWEHVLNLRQSTNKLIEVLRQDKVIGSSLEVEVHLWIPEGESNNTMSDALQTVFGADKLEEQLSELFITSKIQVHHGSASASDSPSKTLQFDNGTSCTISVNRVGDLHKCERCWRYLAEQEGHICGRCEGVVREIGYVHGEQV